VIRTLTALTSLSFLSIACAAVDVRPLHPNAADALVDRCYFMGNSYGGGKGFHFNENHVQMVLNDIIYHKGRIYANSSWDEGNFHLGAYDAETGEMVGKASRWKLQCKEPPRTLFHAEGAYGIAADDHYVYGGGLAKIFNRDARKDEYFNVIWRCDLNLDNADFEGGEGMGNMLKLSKRDKFFVQPEGHQEWTKISGMAEHAGELFVADPVAKGIHVVRTSDMSILEDRFIPFENPGWMTVDQDAKLWIVDRDSKDVRQFTRGRADQPGRATDIVIRDLEEPADLCVNAQGNLLIADNGITRQQVRAYDTRGKFLGSFGRPAYGTIEDDTFFGINGLDTDEAGNFYVTSNGVPGNQFVDFFHGRVGRGAEMHKLTPKRTREWSLYALEFVTVGSIDPGSETDYFTPENWITLDYDAPMIEGPDQPNWQLKANTIDPLAYPNDMRMHIYAKWATVERTRGEKLMIVGTDFQNQFLGIYRFEGSIAVPVALLAKNFKFKHKMTQEFWPPHAPNGPGLWLDQNGDGDFQANEFQQFPGKLKGWGYGDVRILEDGTLAFHDWNHIYHVPMDGFSKHGVPQWDFDQLHAVGAPEPDISKVIRVVYLEAEDSALVSFYKSDDDDYPIGKVIGNRVRRYDNWSALFDGNNQTQPERRWELHGEDLPFKLSDFGHHGRLDKFMPIALHAKHEDYFFIGYDLHSESEPGDEPFPAIHCPDIRVFSMQDASYVGKLEPQKEVYYGTHAALDIGQNSITVHRLEDGRYFVAFEDYCGGKNIYYLWQPE